jgi:hypothetical protein
LWITNDAMVRAALNFVLVLSLGAGLLACADRQEIKARQMADEASANAEDDATCRAKGTPGSANYDTCRQNLADQRARKAEIEYQKRRDFDRVLGAGTDTESAY